MRKENNGWVLLGENHAKDGEWHVIHPDRSRNWFMGTNGNSAQMHFHGWSSPKYKADPSKIISEKTMKKICSDFGLDYVEASKNYYS